MNKKQRNGVIVSIDVFLIVVNLGMYFTTKNVFLLGVAFVFMCLFIFDWNRWLKK